MRRFGIPALLLIGLLSLGGCSPLGASSESGSSSDSGGTPDSAPLAPSEAEAPAFDTDTGDGREVIVTGSVLITAVDPIAASEETVRIVEAAGGRIDARTEYAPTEGDNGRAVLTLRIPASELSQTLGELKQLGTVEKVQTSAADVTRQAQDLDARIAALSTSLDRLLELLAVAEDTEVLLMLESEITERQATLDSLRSQRSLLSDQVAMSTITLELRSVASAPVGAPSTFVDALAAGFASFVAFFTGLALVLGYLLPWLVLLALLALGILLLVRRRRKGATPLPEA